MDQLSLSALAASVLTEGVRFLYDQASELLKRHRDEVAEPAEIPEATARILDGRLKPLSADMNALEYLRPELQEIRRLLVDYADGVEPVSSDDDRLLQSMDALRQILETIYGQEITFAGERRAPSAPIVTGTVDIGTVAEYAAGVRAGTVSGSSRIHGSARADTVRDGGEVIGVDIDRIGES